MLFQIQEVGPAQFAQSAAVIREAFLTVAEEFGFTPENNPTNGAFLQPDKLAEEYEKGIRLFGLFAGEQQLGFMAIENKNGETCYLEKLAVLPAHRHEGYGRALIQHAKEYVRGIGARELSIAIINENAQLKAWYETLGFVEIGLKRFQHLSFTVCFLSLRV